MVPPEPSPIVSLTLTDDALPDRWDDPSIAYGAAAATMLDEKRTELADVLVQACPDASRGDHDHDHDEHYGRDGRNPLARRLHPWSAHPYANPLAAVNPSPRRPYGVALHGACRRRRRCPAPARAGTTMTTIGTMTSKVATAAAAGATRPSMGSMRLGPAVGSV